MNKYFKKSTKRSVISMLSIAITLCLLFSLLFPGKAVNAAPRMKLIPKTKPTKTNPPI